jgi:hypothetical protein
MALENEVKVRLTQVKDFLQNNLLDLKNIINHRSIIRDKANLSELKDRIQMRVTSHEQYLL